MVNGNHVEIDNALARTFVPKREPGAHKWGVGGVLVIAGSPSYPGAAILASRAAGRAGAGIVQLAAPRSVIGIVAAAIPEVAHLPLPETESASGARQAAGLIREHAAKAKAILIGPGLGDDEASHGLLGGLFGFGERASSVRTRLGFGGTAVPAADGGANGDETLQTATEAGMVVDADALNWLARQPSWWEHLPPRRLVLTPHPGEMSRLLDRPVEEIVADPETAATEAARTWHQVVLLKGERAVVSDGERTLVAAAGAPSLTTAGSGDVLAGTVAALLAQTGSPVDAAALAVYLGLAASREVESRFGVTGLLATDLPDAIATAMVDLTA